MVYTVAIIGCGSRGHDAYGVPIHKKKEQFKIVSVCDTNEIMLSHAKNDFEISDENAFLSDEQFLEKKRADILVIATPDRDHVRIAVRALKLGYHLLLEKPITGSEEQLKELLEAQKKYDRRVIVCHVLRYAPAFMMVKDILDEGKIGKLVCIDALEQVAFWHQAHSFVRGNWRNSDLSSSMILQKCCHDLDLLQYYANSECDTVYSVGDLSFFNRDNQPEGAADRCADCKFIKTCPYSAENIYVGRWDRANRRTEWPYNVVDTTRPITEESLRKAYREGPYGRCVFACDNNVVDHQKVCMRFKNNVKASLTMTGFTDKSGRIMTFHGTLGEIELNENLGTLRLAVYGKQAEYFKISEIINAKVKDAFGHGGGDQSMLDTLYGAVAGTADSRTGLKESVESHLMAITAEKSRLSGNVEKVHHLGEEK